MSKPRGASAGRVAAAVVTEIIVGVARDHRLAPECLVSQDRRRHVVTARDQAMLAVRRLTGASTTRIGELFGGRDHTTVVAALWRAEGDERWVRKLREMKVRNGGRYVALSERVTPPSAAPVAGRK